MFDPHQHRFANRLRTKRFRCRAAVLLAPALVCMASATAWADGSITLDFVRHAQSADNAAGILDTTPPGTGLTPEGVTQADQLVGVLGSPTSYAGIYASEFIRTQETAAQWMEAEAVLGNSPLPVTDLSGLNEINAGIFDGQPVFSPEGLLYMAAPIAWSLGAVLVPIPGSTDPNGIAFDERFSQAVQTIYDNTFPTSASNPTDVAFTSEGAMTTWAMMNVKNPDFSLMLSQLLNTGQFVPNTDQIVLQGDPQDGWTMVSFDGQPVPPASLPTELFVDLRNLVEAPQFAAYDIQQAFLGGDPTTIMNAIEAGISQVSTATEQFPVAVFDDILSALGVSVPGAAANLGTDLSALLPGELGSTIGAALASL